MVSTIGVPEVGDPSAQLRICQWPPDGIVEPSCSQLIAADAHPNTRYCADHSVESRRRRPGTQSATGQPPPGADTPPPGGTAPGKLAKEISGQLYQAGVMIFLVDQVCGASVMVGAEQLGVALENLARANPTFKRWLETGLTTGGIFAVIAAAGAIVLPMLAHHGVLPDALIPPGLRQYDQHLSPAPGPPAADGPAVMNGQQPHP